jgi:hypothetical protein
MMSSMLLQAQTASFFKDGVGMLEYLWALWYDFKEVQVEK